MKIRKISWYWILALSNNIYLTRRTILRINVCTLLCSASAKCYQKPHSIFHPPVELLFSLHPWVSNWQCIVWVHLSLILSFVHNKTNSVETNTDKIISFNLEAITEMLYFRRIYLEYKVISSVFCWVYSNTTAQSRVLVGFALTC